MIVYLAALVGLAITIYTFGLTFLAPIIEQIAKSKKLSEEEKSVMRNNVYNGYEELKEDVWTISICLVGVIFVMIIEGCGYNYTRNIDIIWLPIKAPFFHPIQATFNVILFFKIVFFYLTTKAYWDLVNSLLTISSILIETTRQNTEDNK